jgi:hypothetical protein
MNGVLTGLAMLAAVTSSTRSDPPGGILDPPPGPQDYIGDFPLHRWVFGKLLWQGPEPCTSDFCEAAYNARPLYLLVQKEKNCCGEAGYSLTVVARMAGCSSVSYYLVFSKDFDKLRKAERLAFLSRHVVGVASAITSSCGRPLGASIPTASLSSLWR